jgi:catechol 2,3-dioxygenase-like lactoylglutathione lyase family enzyme
MGVTRIVPYLESDSFDGIRDFYVGVLGLTVAMEDPDNGAFLGLGSPANPSAQIVVAAPGVERPLPRLGIDVGDAAAVDAAHAEAVRRGLEVVYPLTDEPWGIRRFFVKDPSGTVISVLAHLA